MPPLTCCDPTSSPQALGRVGKVVKVFGDGNLRVAVGGQRWTFSPSCLVAYRPEEDANLDVAERARENKSAASVSVAGGRQGSPWPTLTSTLPPGSLSVALDKLRTQKSDPEHPGRLVVEAALGNVARVLDLLRRHPEQASYHPALPVTIGGVLRVHVLAFFTGGHKEPGQNCPAGGCLPGPGRAGTAAAAGKSKCGPAR